MPCPIGVEMGCQKGITGFSDCIGTTGGEVRAAMSRQDLYRTPPYNPKTPATALLSSRFGCDSSRIKA